MALGDGGPSLVAEPASTRPRRGRPRRRSRARRHPWLAVPAALLVLLTPVWWSLGWALASPALGTSLAARGAEWVRDHGGGPVVTWAENVWYSHHPPAVGGRPRRGAIPAAAPAPAPTPAGVAHLPAPAPVRPLVAHPAPGEGRWHPVGRRVDGVPAVYEAFLRPDAVHTSLVAGIAWMDTRLLRARLYSGSYIPGGGPWRYSAPVGEQAATSLVAAFNGGFRMADAEGGYFSEGRTVRPLRVGDASLVIYRDGTVTVGQWGRDVTAGPNVVAVRQNLHLLVDHGRPVPGLNGNDHHAWGRTLGGRVYVWRSGLGVTADGAVVYVAGPGLSITSLADLLVHAGAVRGMELDINTDWVDYAVWQPATPNGAATPANGRDLLPTMYGTPGRYFAASWARDFVTMSARQAPGP